jgi:hypothetical protein
MFVLTPIVRAVYHEDEFSLSVSSNSTFQPDKLQDMLWNIPTRFTLIYFLINFSVPFIVFI